MTTPFLLRRFPILAALSVLLAVSGCVNAIDTMVVTDAVAPTPQAAAASADPKSQECLARAMYFESSRSSETGMLAVGTVVMNRVESGSYPPSVCGVVGQSRQFAPGVMTRPMGAGRDLAMKIAADVLAGKRHAGVKTAKFFHTAGLKFPYRNMHYVAIAGGNAFYQKIGRKERQEIRLASQDDVRGRQESEARAGTDVTAVALASRESERRKDSPFASLWQALTDKPAKPSPRLAPAGAHESGKGGRVTEMAARSEDDAASSALADRMHGLPGVATGPAFAGSASVSASAGGDTGTQLRESFSSQ